MIERNDELAKKMWYDKLFQEVDHFSWFKRFITRGPFPYEEIKRVWR